MRSWNLLVVAMLAACDDGPKELRYGEATSYLGLDPVGGLYNPALAGCTVIGATWTERWDELGRNVAATWEYGESEVSWDGPCVTRLDMRTVEGATYSNSRTCDEKGWPVAWEETGVDEEGVPAEPDSGDYENVYDGRRLIETTDSHGYTTTYAWKGNRLVSDDGPGAPIAYTWNPDGWIAEEQHSTGPVTYHYDDDGRLISRSDWSGTKSWDYAADGRWPNLSTFTSAESEITETELEYDCP